MPCAAVLVRVRGASLCALAVDTRPVRYHALPIPCSALPIPCSCLVKRKPAMNFPLFCLRRRRLRPACRLRMACVAAWSRGGKALRFVRLSPPGGSAFPRLSVGVSQALRACSSDGTISSVVGTGLACHQNTKTKPTAACVPASKTAMAAAEAKPPAAQPRLAFPSL